jgi:hypothetical protein
MLMRITSSGVFIQEQSQEEVVDHPEMVWEELQMYSEELLGCLEQQLIEMTSRRM